MSEPPPTDVTSPPPGRARRALRNRSVRIAGTVVVTGAAVAYLISKIDLGKTAHIMATASLGWLALSAFLTLVTVPPQAWRWKLLLRARGVDDNVPWLTRTYFVSYAVGQVLPTGVGGDASRIYETTRRHPGAGSPIAGSVVLERAIGGAVTLVLVAIGFLLAIGHYPVGPYLWIEALFVVGTIVAGVVVFSARLRRHLRARGAAAAPRRGWSGSCARSTRASTATGTTRDGCSSSPAITIGGAALADRRHLGRRPGGRRRALAPAVRRARPAALPGHARARSRSTGSACARRSSSAS